MRLTHIAILTLIFLTAVTMTPSSQAAAPIGNRWLVILNEKPVAEKYPGRIERTRAAAAPYRQHLQQVQTALRPQIEATHARVTGNLQHLLNGILVVATPAQAAALRKLPGVKAVAHLRTYHKADQLSLSNVQGAWSAAGIGGESNAGAGIKIGILDTGIDQSQAAFQDSSLVAPSGYPIADSTADLAFTSNKVIVARSYVADIVYADVSNSSNLAAQSRPDDLTARDLDGHGTAVASVAAGETTTYNGVSITGVAPKAFLGNYKIFGSDDVNPNGSGNILQALEDAVTDGMDVVNMSFGGSAYGGPLDEGCTNGTLPTGPIGIVSDACDPLAYEVESAMENALVTVVVAAGNQGADGYQFNYGCSGQAPCYSTPTFGSVGSPAYAPSAIAVGGIQNDVTYVQQIQVAGFQTIDAFQSYDGPPLDATLTAPLADATQTGNSLCSAVSPTALSGEIALVRQGTCDDVTMVTNAQTAGAVGVIEIASSASFLLPYGLTGTNIPTFIIGQQDGANLISYIDNNPRASTTMDPKPYQVSADSLGLLPYSVAFFSSRGPVPATGALKPDLVAAATDFLLPVESYDSDGELFSYSGYTTTQGTSFSTPMVTGSAALVKQANPNFSPLQIRSALVNTASATNLSTADYSGTAASVSEIGAGLLQAQNAVKSTVQIVPATVSFGLAGVSLTTTQSLTFTNTGSSQVTLAMTVTPSAGLPTGTPVLINNSNTATLNVPSNGTATATVSLSGTPSTAGRFEGVISISGGPVPLTVPYLYVVGNGVPYDIIPLNDVQPGQGFVAFDGAVGAEIPWTGTCVNTNNNCLYDYGPVAIQVIDQYGVPVSGVPVTWAVTQGGGSIVSAYTDSTTDSNGLAGATVVLGSAGPQEFTATVSGMTMPFDGYARVVPAITTGFIVDAASFTKGKAVAPGSWIAVYGTNLTDTTQGADGTNYAFANCPVCNTLTQPFPMGIDGASFSFDTASLSLPGRFSYVSPTQLNVQVPWELTGQTSATVKSIVNYTYSSLYTLPLAEYSPGFFVYDQANDVAALDLNYRLVGSTNPVARGDYVQLYLNGLGPVSNQPGDGLAAPGEPFAKTLATPTITIGGQTVSTIQFSGLAPGYVSLYQVNVQVPAGLSAGPQTITCTIGGVTSQTAQLYVK